MAASAAAGGSALVGIVGHPIAHTLSPAMHNAAFAALGMRWHYAAFDVRPEDVAKAIAGARALGVYGLNVTAPHKAAAAREMDRLVGAAAELGLVNTIVFGASGAVGHSSDGEGFLAACAERGWEPGPGMRAVVVGAGGAGVSVAHALRGCGMQIVLANRNPANLAEAMARLGEESAAGMTLADPELGRQLARADLLVIAVPPAARLERELDLSALRPDARVVDLAYVPVETPVVAAARARGLEAWNGLGMLVHQGALSFTLWTGREPPLDTMAAAVGYAIPKHRSRA